MNIYLNKSLIYILILFGCKVAYNDLGIAVIYETDIECKNTLTLYNAIGQQIAFYKLSGNAGKFNFSTANLLPGIYAYKFICNNNPVENGKIVIIH